MKRRFAWLLLLLLPTGIGCVASGAYRAGYYVAPGPAYYRTDCAFIDICPNGQRRCCFTADGYPTRMIP